MYLSAMVACLLMGPTGMSPAIAQERVSIEINTARSLEGRDAVRPQEVDFAAARDTALPDNWLRTRPTFRGVVWYAVPLDGALAALSMRSDEERVVLVPRVADRGEFWLNGERLPTEIGVTRNQTLWLPLPPHALRPAGNFLQVRVEGVGEVRDGLSTLELGTASALRLAYETRRLFQTLIPVLTVLRRPRSHWWSCLSPACSEAH